MIDHEEIFHISSSYFSLSMCGGWRGYFDYFCRAQDDDEAYVCDDCEVKAICRKRFIGKEKIRKFVCVRKKKGVKP